MANLYLDESLADDRFAPGASLEISGDEARHAVRVSRLRVGETTRVGNGQGVVAIGVVEEANPDRFRVRISEVRGEAAPDPLITIVQALAKGDRAERAIEQATEFGADACIPWQAERSIVRWNFEKADRGREKWQRIAREATKQSLRSRVPRVLPLATTRDLCARAGSHERAVLVLQPGAARSLRGWAEEHVAEFREIDVIVGPEGGLGPEELAALQEAGGTAVSLGDRVLRTSSAGPAALAVLHTVLGRW